MHTTGHPGERKTCPSCGTENPAVALFCGECGGGLQAPAACPSCGASIGPDADLCETCGTLTGGAGCRFCGEADEPGAPFCPACGNPRAGILCPGCGTRSFFDFCPGCAAALTEAARSELRRADEEKRSGPFDEAEDLRRLKSYISGGRVQTPPSAPVRDGKPVRFSSNREARLYHTARRPTGAAFWRCAADSRTHTSPAACSRPRYGGIWTTGADE